MTIKSNLFGNMEIEIKARGLHNNDRYNKKDTLTILNTLSIFAHECANLYYKEGADAIGEEAEDFATILYDVCAKAGLYKKI